MHDDAIAAAVADELPQLLPDFSDEKGVFKREATGMGPAFDLQEGFVLETDDASDVRSRLVLWSSVTPRASLHFIGRFR